MTLPVNEIICGDCLDIMRALPDNSVHCCVTSPPYWGLRDYGVDGQIGLETMPEEYVAKMVAVFREVRRVLREDGTCWVNLGTSYAGSTMTGGNNGINASGGADGFKQKRQFRRVSGGSDPIPSPLLQRVPAYGSGGTKSQGCRTADRVCPDSDGGPQDETLIHRARTARTGQFASPDEPQPCTTGRDSGPQDCDEAPLPALPDGVPQSTTLESSCLPSDAYDPASAALGRRTEGQTSPGNVPVSAHTTACTCGTSPMLPPLVVRTLGKESFYSACHSPDCQGIGRCGLCWVSLTIPSLNVKAKDEINIPHLVAMALQADGWYLRQTIVWHKPNPMPESVTDRCTKAHEYMFLLTKSARYFYDAEVVKEDAVPYSRPNCAGARYTVPGQADHSGRTDTGSARNKRSVWKVATAPYKGAHFATFPPELIRPCIRAGCPKDGIVIDPFGGSGTTGMVAAQEGRNYILIELNPQYVEMAESTRLAEVNTGVPVREAKAGQMALFGATERGECI